ncbi:hypothetical protein HY990_06855 [Candidatus Micrarchaeota archaeon]|nr:hypothetical protein [Candidatus Micrarchaeota archaeon]
MRFITYDPLAAVSRYDRASLRDKLAGIKPQSELLRDSDIRAIEEGISLKRGVYRLLRREYPKKGDITAHLINGFGHYYDRDESATDHIAELFEEPGTPRIRNDVTDAQGGDYHPWQTLAYSCMAGLAGKKLVGGEREFTLQDIAKASTEIQTYPKGDGELGHLLFAAAHLVPDRRMKFEVDNERVTLEKLLERAIEVLNNNDPSAVCFGTHLIEGICAVATLVHGIQFKEEAQELLGTYLEYTLYRLYRKNQRRIDRNDLHKIGHAAEAAAFGKTLGYELVQPHEYAIADQLSRMARVMDQFTLGEDTLLGGTHLRRAATLWREIDKCEKQCKPLNEVDRTTYHADVEDSY